MGQQIPTADPDRGFRPSVSPALENHRRAKVTGGNLYGFTARSSEVGYIAVLDRQADAVNGPILPGELLDSWAYPTAGAQVGVGYSSSGGPVTCQNGIQVCHVTADPTLGTLTLGGATSSFSVKYK